jgi:hypothetical protein
VPHALEGYPPPDPLEIPLPGTAACFAGNERAGGVRFP